MVSAIIASYIAASLLRPPVGGRIVACPVLIVPATRRKTGGLEYFAAGRNEVPTSRSTTPSRWPGWPGTAWRRQCPSGGLPDLTPAWRWETWPMTYVPAPDRYDQIPYRRCGRSGIKLPEISLGLWQNFGSDRPLDVQRAIILRAFDLGVTHFDLANNYGGNTLSTSDDPLGRLETGSPYGSAERNFGRILREDLRPYRDELIIPPKAGSARWPGPYGDGGSR